MIETEAIIREILKGYTLQEQLTRVEQMLARGTLGQERDDR